MFYSISPFVSLWWCQVQHNSQVVRMTKCSARIWAKIDTLVCFVIKPVSPPPPPAEKIDCPL